MRFDQGGHFPKVRFLIIITFHIVLWICAYVQKWAALDEENQKKTTQGFPELLGNLGCFFWEVRFIPCIEKKTDEQEDGSIDRFGYFI